VTNSENIGKSDKPDKMACRRVAEF